MTNNYRPKYKTGPQGNHVVDYAAERGEYPKEFSLNFDVPDRRFNDDPEEFYRALQMKEMRIAPALIDSRYYETRNGQLAFEVHP